MRLSEKTSWNQWKSLESDGIGKHLKDQLILAQRAAQYKTRKEK